MKYSILIPSYDPAGSKRQMVANLLQSIDDNSMGQDYELIIRKNGPSYTESHNDALLSARGDYIIVLNDDVIIQDLNWLEKMTSDTHFMTGMIGHFHIIDMDCPTFFLWGMSREIFNKIGLFDTRFKDGLNFEDNDYHMRLIEAGIDYKLAEVGFTHLGSRTFSTYYKDTQSAMSERNHSVFYEKWKHKITQ